jgi:hypothetical protein
LYLPAILPWLKYDTIVKKSHNLTTVNAMKISIFVEIGTCINCKNNLLQRSMLLSMPPLYRGVQPI